MAADLELGADNTIYAAMGLFVTDGVYSSTTGNSGGWTKLTNFPTSGVYRIELATAPSDANVIYAMTHKSSNNGLGGVYKSSNKGSNWSTLTTPVDDDNGIGNDITRGQAWYDLIAAVDPNDATALYIGGVDLFKTTNSGSSWTQVAHWYGGFGYPEVHADQHAIVFRPGSSTDILFGNDGGTWFTSTGTSSTPSFTNRNNNYNVTQFYACAIHPDAGVNHYLAGAQDNGSQLFNSAGIDATSEATGGDGAFCHIDQTNGDIQFTSYVYNYFYRSTNGGGQLFKYSKRSEHWQFYKCFRL